MRPNLYNTVGGLRTTTLPGARSAFKNAAVTSREAMVLNLDEAAQDWINLNIHVSRSVVVIFPYVSYNSDLVFLRFDGEDNFCWQLDEILPLKLSLLLESCPLLR